MCDFLAMRKHITEAFHKYRKRRDVAEKEYAECKEEAFKMVLNNDWHRADAIMFILEELGEYMDVVMAKRGGL